MPWSRPAAVEPQGKILVVDDNEANRALAQATLEAEGYGVFLAKDAEEGMRLYADCDPDCVLLDIRMPGEDGLSLARRMRATPRGDITPIVFFTALRDVDTFDQAVAAGADDFLMKPVRPSELLVRVQTALRLRQLGSERKELLEIARSQRDELLRVQLQKELLSAFVVHDLKNPVNTIDLLAQLMLRDKTASDSIRSSAADIRVAARQLSRLILNLLDVAKSAEGKLSPELAPTELRALAEDVLREMVPEAGMRDLSMSADGEEVTVAVDRDLVRRTMVNLVENAIRHSPPGGAVTIQILPTQADVFIRVRDEGPGIAESLRDKIFDRFVQIDGALGGSTRNGRGLGLTFCKLSAEAHGGHIEVEPGEGGATFRLTLPRVELPARG